MEKIKKITIYINERPLVLTNAIDKAKTSKGLNQIISPFIGGPKQVLQFVDMFEKNAKVEKVILTHKNFKYLKKEVFSLFQIIEASGGVVMNKDKMLAIFRRGFWDLPKGKIEKNEGKRAAALREVMEETGLASVSIADKICKTYHVYRLKSKKRILKKTYWYLMQTKEINTTPQTEEEIERIEWVEKADFVDNYKPIFNNILEVVRKV